MEFFFDLRKNSHIITIENIEYTFILKLKYPNNLFRIEDSSNLYMIYNVGIEDYKQGFIFKIEDRNYNVKIDGINIVKIAEEGIYNNNDGKLGDLYLIIQPILNFNLNQSKNSSFKTVTSIKINELYK